VSTAQNNGETAARVGRPFPKGVSGNPGGRPKGLARYVRELVGDDGRRIADFMLSVLEDESERTETRMKAAEWLADRGYGKAVDFKPQDEEDPLGLADARDRLAGKLAPVVALHDPGAEGKGQG